LYLGASISALLIGALCIGHYRHQFGAFHRELGDHFAALVFTVDQGEFGHLGNPLSF
jgi:hypothetical protein